MQRLGDVHPVNRGAEGRHHVLDVAGVQDRAEGHGAGSLDG
jgi:hypothetical protein